MLTHSAKAGAFNLQSAVTEALISMRRAGADVIISYFVPKVCALIKLSKIEHFKLFLISKVLRKKTMVILFQQLFSFQILKKWKEDSN